MQRKTQCIQNANQDAVTYLRQVVDHLRSKIAQSRRFMEGIKKGRGKRKKEDEERKKKEDDKTL